MVQTIVELLAVPQQEDTRSAWDKALSVANIKSGFRKTGIFPINREAEAIQKELAAAPARQDVLDRAEARKRQRMAASTGAAPGSQRPGRSSRHPAANADALLALAAVAEQELADARREAFTVPASHVARMDHQILARRHLETGSVLYTSQQARDHLRAAVGQQAAKKAAAEARKAERARAKEIAKARQKRDKEHVFDPSWLQLTPVALTAEQQQLRAHAAAKRAERKRLLQKERAEAAARRNLA